jgi:hypothetical protein
MLSRTNSLFSLKIIKIKIERAETDKKDDSLLIISMVDGKYFLSKNNKNIGIEIILDRKNSIARESISISTDKIVSKRKGNVNGTSKDVRITNKVVQNLSKLSTFATAGLIIAEDIPVIIRAAI